VQAKAISTGQKGMPPSKILMEFFVKPGIEVKLFDPGCCSAHPRYKCSARTYRLGGMWSSPTKDRI